MAARGSFPLLVQGSWGPEPPQNLSTKLQMYFQSPKRSGGGECEVRQETGSPPQFLLFFHLEDVRRKVLERENHELVWPGQGTFKLTVQLPTAPVEAHVVEGEIATKESKAKERVKEPDGSEELDAKLFPDRRSKKIEAISKECEKISSLVAFENLKANVTDIMLILLVETISGLTNGDFQVEILRDFDVAVVTFPKYVDVMKFIDDCAKHHSMKHLKLSPRVLEVTKTIRVENLPPGVENCNLKSLFENPQNGGGRIASIECFPEESSALIEFFDSKVLDTIMTKKFDLFNMPLSVFPYYTSLGTALYGKEKPLIKLPAPFRESLALPLWKFLQQKTHLIEEINDEVRRCHCELTWSPLSCEVTVRPAATLVNQGRLRIKTWQKNASTALSSIRAKYKVISFKVDPIVWDTVKNDVEDDRILTEFDACLGIINLVGKSEDIQSIESQIKELIESTMQKIKREKQSLKEKVAISPGKYSLLYHSGVQKQLCTECPDVEISYDEASQHMYLKGLQADVRKVKWEIQEKVYAMAKKNIHVPPEVFQFLQQVNCAELSKSLFIAQKILATCELDGTTVFLTGYSFDVLLEAEKQISSALNYKRIDIEDKGVLNDKKWKELTQSLSKKYNSSPKTIVINQLTSGTTAEVMISGYVGEVNKVHDLLYEFLEKHIKIERLIEVKSSLVFDYLRIEKKLFWQKIKRTGVQVIFNSENKQKGILLIGPKIRVLEEMNIIKQARDSVCVKSIRIDKPGTSQFFKDKARYYKGEVKQLFGCCIELQESEGEQAGGGTRAQKCLCRTEVVPGVSLTVQQGDLTRFPVDVVVNMANENLKLSGGLAAALSQAAGPELQADCDQIVKRRGKVLPGHATISKAGQLPYHHVIHLVGPQWKQDGTEKHVCQQKRAVGESLRLAEEHKYRSIAIPAVSSGVLGFPLALCAGAIVLAIKENFQRSQAGCTLKEIYLVGSVEKTVEAFADAVKDVFKDVQPDTASLPNLRAVVPPSVRQVHGSRRTLLTPEGLRILLVRGDVQSSTVSVPHSSHPPPPRPSLVCRQRKIRIQGRSKREDPCPPAPP